MANWSGTHIFTGANSATGTATSGGASSLTDTANTFKTTGSGLSFYTVRLTGGTGSGQERIILSNSATVLSTLTAWTTPPDTSSTYEIVLKLNNDDHITGTITIDSGCIIEVADSATIYLDGAYVVQLQNAAVVRLNKTKTTMATFKPTLGGSSVAGFWYYIYAMATLSTNPAISFIKCENCSYGGVIARMEIPYDLSDIYNIWCKNTVLNSMYVYTAAALTSTKIFSKCLVQRNITGTNLATFGFATASNTGRVEIKGWWVENAHGNNTAASIGASGTTQFPQTFICKDTVLKHSAYVFLGRANSNASARYYFLDNYATPSLAAVASAVSLYGHTSTNTPSGISYLQGNILKDIPLHYGADYHSTVIGIANDCMGSKHNIKGYTGLSSQPNKTGDVTSDRDYFAGWALAPEDRADLSNATSSTETPSQYQYFNQARTNARSARNKTLVFDNIASGSVGDYSAVVSFDSTNGDDFTSSTVNSDSASGQAVLNLSSVTGLIPEETIEIGKGTARYETGIIDSVGGSSVTLKANLTYTHTAVQADAIKKRLRIHAVSGVMYGTTSGVYTEQTRLPSEESFGAIWCGFTPEITRDDGYSFLQEGHSITINNLSPNTTYYYRPIGMTPLGDVVVGAEASFTTTNTAVAANFTDVSQSDVREGITWQYNSPTNNRTGTLDLPVAANVKLGTIYDNTTETGTYDGSERYTDIQPIVVLDSYTWKYNTTGADNRTGTFTVPTVTAIVDAVWDEDLSTHTTPNSAGLLVGIIFRKIRHLIAIFLNGGIK
jgi:hypothetical protein